MTTTFEAHPAGDGIKSRYADLDAVDEDGEVWQVAGRSFSGAWRSAGGNGQVHTGLHSRREAAALITGNA